MKQMQLAPGYDYDAQLADIERRQKIADALLAESMSPQLNQQAGGMTVPYSPLNAILDVITAGIAGKQSNDLKTERSELASNKQNELVNSLQKFQTTSEGGIPSPYDPASTSPDSPYNNPAVAAQVSVPGDPKKGLLDLIASKHPVAQSLGLQMLMENMKAKEGDKDIVVIEGIPYWKDKAGNIGPANMKGGSGLQYEQSYDKQGNLIQRNPLTGKWDDVIKAPRVTTNVQANPIIKGASEAGTNAAGEFLKKFAGEAASDQEALSYVAQMKNLDNGEVISGPMSPVILGLGGLLEQTGLLGKDDVEKVARTQVFDAQSIEMWMKKINENGTARGWVKEESDRIAKALPNIKQSPQARQVIYDIIANKAARTKKRFEMASEKFAQGAGTGDPAEFFKALPGIMMPNYGTSPVTEMPSSRPATMPKPVPVRR